MAKLLFPCGFCGKDVVTNAIECTLCECWIYKKCANLSVNELRKLSSQNGWWCKNCIMLFPFHELNNDEFLLHVNTLGNMYVNNLPHKYMSSNIYEGGESRTDNFEFNIDPDCNLFNHISKTCKYYSEDNFQTDVNNNGFSIIHLNARSISKNFSQINQFLCDLRFAFDIIAISESWMDSSKSSEYDIKGYEVIHQVRQGKRGGGCSLYVRDVLKFKVLDKWCRSVKDLFECCTIELMLDGSKNILVSCMYRTPGNQIASFTDEIDEILHDMRLFGKNFYMCGDFNVDLLKCNNHRETDKFKDMLLSHGMYPLICKPTRICEYSSTLIDNIFTNNLGDIRSGIFINDISDHLPVFACTKDDLKNHRTINKNIIFRDTSETNMNIFKGELSKVNWEVLYNQTDVNIAYDMFIDKFTSLFNNSCPLKSVNKKHNSVNPWLTTGLKMLVKRKMYFRETS